MLSTGEFEEEEYHGHVCQFGLRSLFFSGIEWVLSCSGQLSLTSRMLNVTVLPPRVAIRREVSNPAEQPEYECKRSTPPTIPCRLYPYREAHVHRAVVPPVANHLLCPYSPPARQRTGGCLWWHLSHGPTTSHHCHHAVSDSLARACRATSAFSGFDTTVAFHRYLRGMHVAAQTTMAGTRPLHSSNPISNL